MARHFVASSSQLLNCDPATVTGYPYTLMAWIYPVSWQIAQIISQQAPDHNGRITLTLLNDGRAFHYINDGLGASELCIPTANYVLNSWQHLLAVGVDSTHRYCYLGGANKGSVTTNIGVNTGGDIQWGVGWANSGGFQGQYFDGDLAEIAVWEIALSDAEAVALAAGANPLSIHPEKLIHYWPIWGVTPEIDLGYGQNSLVLGAGSQAPTIAVGHPPVMPIQMFGAPKCIAVSAAPSGGGLLVGQSALVGANPLVGPSVLVS